MGDKYDLTQARFELGKLRKILRPGESREKRQQAARELVEGVLKAAKEEFGFDVQETTQGSEWAIRVSPKIGALVSVANGVISVRQDTLDLEWDAVRGIFLAPGVQPDDDDAKPTGSAPRALVRALAEVMSKQRENE